MKVLILNTYAKGGAGIAASRLKKALNGAGIQADILTSAEVGSRWTFYAERLSFVPFERDKSVRFSFSLANFGKNITQHPLVQAADILHLHWINQGFLSLKSIRDLAKLGKPIVWTLHDMWTFTGGCHYSRGCTHFKNNCGNCPYLRFSSKNDLSFRVLNRKKRLFPADIQYVTCSAWLRNTARTSALLREAAIQAIPNPIDTAVFKPSDVTAREQFKSELGMQKGAFALLFAAMKISEERKGFQYLSQALDLIKAQHPDLAIEIVVMGKSEIEPLMTLPYPVHLLGMIQEAADLSLVYGACDVFVIPSLEDNLPNTVMESLACGTPVVGFDTGGIPEMVEHEKEGIIVPQKDSKELAEGIARILQSTETEMQEFRTAARQKVISNYDESIVAHLYQQVYESLIDKNKIINELQRP
jgi:glycosyltransferase involved in cell wall biosynthesis